MPPARRSTSQRGVVSGAGVNQRCTYSALLHASHTSDWGASNTRDSLSSGFLAPSFPSCTALLLLHFREQSIESVEASFPVGAVAGDPLGRLLEPTSLEP